MAVATAFAQPRAEAADYDSSIAAARSALSAGDYDTAVARASQALQAKPGDRAATDILTRADLRRSMKSDAPAPAPAPRTSQKPSSRQAPAPKANKPSSAPPKVSPQDYGKAMAAAQAALAAEDYEEAVQQANQALKAKPGDEKARGLLTQAEKGKQDKHDHDRGIELAQQAIASGDYPKSISLLNLVLEGWPGDVVAKDLLDRAQKGSDYKPDYDSAIAAAQRALSAGSYDVAISRANEALTLRPGDAKATEVISEANAKKNIAASKRTPAPEPTETVAATLPPPDVTPGPLPSAPVAKRRNHEISFSGDYFLGSGTVSLPLGYSLNQSLGSIPGVSTLVATPVLLDRNSVYFGGTLSYGFRQAWFLDLSYAKGQSSGIQSIDYSSSLPIGSSISSQFSIDDEWYQVYVRYTFPRLRFTKFSAYLRAGGTLVRADLKDTSVDPTLRYSQTDKTQDILGNVGFGLGYTLLTTKRVRLGLQVEGEGFFGNRSQDTKEILPADTQLTFKSANIHNTLYGGIARATVRFEYRLGKSGAFKFFGDGGFQEKYTQITYPGAGSVSETLYGPYIKAGVRYAF